MTILEITKQIINEYPHIEDFTNNIHYDFSGDTEGEAGLYIAGDRKISEDVLGNQMRQSDMIMYATCQAASDYDRLNNSNFLSNLSWYLENVEQGAYEVTIGDDNNVKKGKLEQISCSNAMLLAYLTDELTGPVRYQLQITAQYRIDN